LWQYIPLCTVVAHQPIDRTLTILTTWKNKFTMYT